MTDLNPKHLRALLDLGRRVDDLVEDSLRLRRTIAETIANVLPELCAVTSARGAFLQTFDEDLALAWHQVPTDMPLPARAAILERTGAEKRERFVEKRDDVWIVAQPMDVSGQWFGAAGVVLDAVQGEPLDLAFIAEALDVVCEQLDNSLYSICMAREKHRVTMELGSALQHSVLGEGLKQAVAVLNEAVAVERLLLVCAAEEGSIANLHVQFFVHGKLTVDTSRELPSAEEAAQLRDQARAYLANGDPSELSGFDLGGARQEVLINGLSQSRIIGRVLVKSASGNFNTHDRELLAAFVEFIRQRIVDFNKEWRTLARCFSPDVVTRLLQDSEYVTRYLAPREAEVAMLYADIAGFTRLSEQVLRTPNAVAALVETWSREAVDIVWKHGGVFDKMVGDCVIALFGPPFYGDDAGDRALRALKCALEIREMSTALAQRQGFEVLRECGLAITAGVNLAPLFVGTFGPNDNFTGFSSGMNNTARLQGCGERNEIVVMSSVLARLPDGHGLEFGPERSAKVKNVADALRFHTVDLAMSGVDLAMSGVDLAISRA
jgi:adenylate cyclase